MGFWGRMRRFWGSKWVFGVVIMGFWGRMRRFWGTMLGFGAKMVIFRP